MTTSRYDYEGLWFHIYLKVLKHNETLGDAGLDRSQLREVTTSIFIAQTQRGITRPIKTNTFTESVLQLVSEIKDREMQESIYKTLINLVKTKDKKGD